MTRISLPHKAIAHLQTAVSLSETSLKIEVQAFDAFVNIDGDYVFAILRGAAARELVKIDIANSADGILKVERGQGGTIATAWPAGTLIVNTTHEDHYNSIIQRGTNRIVDYNPNSVLTPLFAGEKVYQEAPAGAERWWKSYNGVDSYWDIITGGKVGIEKWIDVGFDYPVLLPSLVSWTLRKDLSDEVPAQAIVYSLFYDAGNDILLAGTGNGGQIWKSIDHGLSWTLKQDLTEAIIYCFAKDTSSDVLVCGTASSAQIWKSTDAGDTWILKKDLSLEVPAQGEVTALTYDPDTDRLIAGTTNRGQIWVSADAGETWTLKKDMWTDASQGTVYDLTYDTGYNRVLLSTGPNGQIWASTNGGDTWTLKKDLSLESPSQTRAYTLAYDPTLGRLFAGTYPDGQIWTSDNGGDTWTLRKDLSLESPAQDAVFSFVYDSNIGLAIAGTTPDAQIWVSSDGGLTWTLKRDLSNETPAQSGVYSLAYDSVAERAVAGTIPDAQIWTGE